MGKKSNDDVGGGADPTQSPEALAAAEAERIRLENEAAKRAEADRAAAAEAEAERAAFAVAGLVTVFKDGEYLEVDPSCVKAHESAGWKVQG